MAMTREMLQQKAMQLPETDILETDCDIIEFLLDNCQIEVPEQNRFFVRVNCVGIVQRIRENRLKRYADLLKEYGLAEGNEAMAYTGYADFGHTSAGWDSVISLGIYGLRNRVAEFACQRDSAFYTQTLRVYDAALRFMERAAQAALCQGKTEMGEGLLNLCKAAPRNLFEAQQTSILYYFLQQYFDGSDLRTLGRLDRLWYPYYEKEEKHHVEQLLLDYLREINQIEAVANLPFAIGGQDVDGNATVNALSYALLDAYKTLRPEHVKLHLLCAETTPRDILEAAFRSIRDGGNSIVFLSDSQVVESLINQGAEPVDAANYHIVGCYECGAEGEITCSCNARVNIPKALELALNQGCDMLTGKQIGLKNHGKFETYEELFAEFVRQLNFLCQCAMKATDLYEKQYPALHSAPILSGTYLSALEQGKDIYRDYGAKYNNSSLNAIGIATATDSLAAIRKAVFEDQLLTLEELTAILKKNWEGNEYLRLLIKNKYPKYGQGQSQVDQIAQTIVNVLADTVSGQPNVKGGTYRLGLFSIDWKWMLGKRTAASADGRLREEPLSQNTGACLGADKAGVTAHLLSVASLDTARTPNGAIVDIDLHNSAVGGENGLAALVASLQTYFALGGFAVHYNVLDANILKDAKKHPEKYPTLQVRLCGWNVLFSSLREKEQEEFIARAMG